MKKICILLFATLAMLGSCDLLEPEQTNLIYNEVFWTSQKDAETGLLGVYGLYRALMVNSDNWFGRGDATTGFFDRGHNGGSASQLWTPGDFSVPTGTEKGWGSLQNMANWANFYKVIASANLVISNIERMNDNAFGDGMKDKLLGEAYFLRALTYFNILRIWGNAPYIAEPIESSEQVIDDDLVAIQIPRTEDWKIAQNVLSDVELARKKLKYGRPNDAGWGIRANLGSADMLAGHLNMWIYFLATRDAKPNPGQYLTNAISALESLSTNGSYSLVDYQSANLLRTLYRNTSSESIFELNVSFEQNESYRADLGGIQSISIKLQPFDNDVMKDRTTSINWVSYAVKDRIYPEYDWGNPSAGDIRPDLFFDVWHSTYTSRHADNNPSAPERNMVTWMKKYNFVMEDPQRLINEWVAYFADCNIPVFRYTDAKLLLAEAYVKNNEQEKARTIVNEIRLRAGLGPFTGADLGREVLQQRFSELIGEGQIYFDMVRNNTFPVGSVMTPDRYAQQGYYWPVAGTILTANKQVQQTPFWNGKTTW